MYFAQFITVLRSSRSCIGAARRLVIIAASIRMSMFRQVRLCMGEEPEMAEFHTDRLMKRPWDTKMKSWLGGLDSNQDSQLQRLMYYRLYDLPAEIGEAGQYHRLLAFLSASCQTDFRRANHDATRSQ